MQRGRTLIKGREAELVIRGVVYGEGAWLTAGRVAWVFCVGVVYEGGGVACGGGRGHTGRGLGRGLREGAWLPEVGGAKGTP